MILYVRRNLSQALSLVHISSIITAIHLERINLLLCILHCILDTFCYLFYRSQIAINLSCSKRLCFKLCLSLICYLIKTFLVEIQRVFGILCIRILVVDFLQHSVDVLLHFCDRLHKCIILLLSCKSLPLFCCSRKRLGS